MRVKNTYRRNLLALTKRWWLTGNQMHFFHLQRIKDIAGENNIKLYQYHKATIIGKILIVFLDIWYKIIIIPVTIIFICAIQLIISSFQFLGYVFAIVFYTLEKYAPPLLYKIIYNEKSLRSNTI